MEEMKISFFNWIFVIKSGKPPVFYFYFYINQMHVDRIVRHNQGCGSKYIKFGSEFWTNLDEDP